MCTLALYFHMFDDYPLLVAANRDEHFDRPSAPPALNESSPKIVAGTDLRAGGTWLGVNEHGLLAGILNRRSNGKALPQTPTRSRGLLCLELLRQESTAAAEKFLAAHDGLYNPYTVVCADRDYALVAYNEDRKIIVRRLDPGLHVFSSAATVDLNSAKANRAHKRFALLSDRFAAPTPPERWVAALEGILADHSLQDGSDDPSDAICVHRESAGTVSSSVLLLSAATAGFETFFCPGAPCRNSFVQSVSLPLR